MHQTSDGSRAAAGAQIACISLHPPAQSVPGYIDMHLLQCQYGFIYYLSAGKAASALTWAYC